MGIGRTSQCVVAAAVGITAGVAMVPHEDWFTKLIGALLGGVLFVAVFACLSSLTRLRNRFGGGPRVKPHAGRWDDFDETAYRVERVFMDDGKPW